MPLDLERFRVYDGDVILICGASDPRGAAEIVKAMISSRDPGVSNVQILALDKGTTIQSVPENEMRVFGWKRIHPLEDAPVWIPRETPGVIVDSWELEGDTWTVRLSLEHDRNAVHFVRFGVDAVENTPNQCRLRLVAIARSMSEHRIHPNGVAK